MKRIKGFNEFVIENKKSAKEESNLINLSEQIVQNLKSSDFDGSNPNKIQIHNAGVGGVRTLQQHRKRIADILEDMLKKSKSSVKNHDNAYFNLGNILYELDLLKSYLKNHQTAIEELEDARKRGGTGGSTTIPKGLI